MCNRFCLCYLLVVLVFCCATVENVHQHLPTSPQCSNCFCYKSGDLFQMQCPVDGFDPSEQNLDVKYSQYRQGSAVTTSLEVNCPCDSSNPELVTSSVYDFLDHVEASNISVINLNYCPSASFSDLFRPWSNTSVTKFLFRSCKPLSTLSARMLSEFTHLTHLYLQSNSFDALPDNVFSETVNLEQLMLNNNKLTEIPNGIFRNLQKLVILQLGSNQIKLIDKDVFSNLGSLFQLNLEGNLLEIIPDNLFAPLTNLTILDLSKNQISRLDADLLSSSFQLVELGLRDNFFAELPAGIFRNNPNLMKIYLQGNQNLAKIERNVFDRLKSLTELDLRNCRLTHSSLDSQGFSNLKQLKLLKLGGNRFHRLNADWFSGLHNLERLDLSRNQLSSIDPDTFADLSKLSTLQLQNNGLIRLQDGVFRGMANLEKLLLSDNNLLEIQTQVLAPLSKSLKNINLANNHLSFQGGVASEFFGAQSPMNMNLQLETMDLSYNNISEILYDWHNMNNLRELNLSHNSIGSLRLSDLNFSPIVNIVVDLRHNQIQEIGEFYLASSMDSSREYDSRFTRILYLDDNPLFCDCDVYFLAKYMNRTLPSVLNYWTIEAPQLTCQQPAELLNVGPTAVDPLLFVCPCDQEESPCGCQHRPYDKTVLINCQHQNLTRLPIQFPAFPGYQIHMNFSRNHVNLTSNQSLSLGLKQISALDLSYNGLTLADMDSPFWQDLKLVYPDLLQLNLRRNLLTSVPERVIELWKETPQLRLVLGGNPWLCSCSQRPLLNFLMTSWSRIEDYDDIYCENGEKLAALTLETMCSDISTALRVTAIVLPMVTIIILVTLALVYRHRRTLRAWMYTQRIFLSCITQEEEEEDDRIYDAFVSYAHQDEDFVVEQLVPQLETPRDGFPPFRLCLHYRDWLAGEWIPEQIDRSVATSKRTIVILSQHFLDSLWGQLEFRTAYQQVLKDKCMRLIIIIKDDLPPKEKLDKELASYLSMNTYLKWGDPWFWHRLRYALPHKKEAGVRISEAIKEYAHDPIDKEQVLGAKLNQLPPLPLLSSDIEMALTPTSPANSHTSGSPLFPRLAK